MTLSDIILRIAILLIVSMPFIIVLLKSRKADSSGREIGSTEKLILFIFWIVLIIALLTTFF
ncbi:hypothetical protein [Salinicoccus albus]|uniref:hypothetical protein n=1 Tax=Salinicoccus albus TaxID=418756 RepID=UPI00037431D1|nr:hypothetical protein [Salinicoccus albus]